MATVRLATTEVQVDDIIYTFDTPDHADVFEACVATVDPSHCEIECAPIGKRPMDHVSHIIFAKEAAPTEDGGIQFSAVVDGKPVQCRISLTALEEHFGARDAGHPLDAFAKGRDIIHTIAERKLRKQPQAQVMIEPQDIA